MRLATNVFFEIIILFLVLEVIIVRGEGTSPRIVSPSSTLRATAREAIAVKGTSLISFVLIFLLIQGLTVIITGMFFVYRVIDKRLRRR